MAVRVTVKTLTTPTSAAATQDIASLKTGRIAQTSTNVRRYMASAVSSVATLQAAMSVTV
jgi:hypothetical protein